MVPSVATEKVPQWLTPHGIDPETVRLVAQCLNHYATPGPYNNNNNNSNNNCTINILATEKLIRILRNQNFVSMKVGFSPELLRFAMFPFTFIECISDVSNSNSKYFHTYITLTSFIISFIRSTTISRWTPQIWNTLYKHTYTFSHSLLLVTYWPEDGLSRPKHVVIVELITYVTQTVVFWRTYPPSFA
jgi:hypothetical protein